MSQIHTTDKTPIDIQIRRQETRELFARNQELLTKLFNTTHIRQKVFFPKEYQNDKVLYVFSNGFIVEKRGKFHIVRSVGHPYAYTIGLALSDIENIKDNFHGRFSPQGNRKEFAALLHYVGIKKDWFTYPLILHTNYNDGAGDGRIDYVSAATWATARGASTGNNNIDSSTTAASPRASLITGNYYIRRGFYPVDTTGYGGGAVTGSFNFHATDANNGNADSASLVCMQTSQASTSSLAESDYGQVTFSDASSRFALSSVSAGNISLALNSTGLALLNNSGFTKIGLMISKDMDNSAPSGENWNCDMNQHANSTNIPYLSIIAASLQKAIIVGQAINRASTY